MSKSGGISDATQKSEVNIAQQQTDIAKQAAASAQKEFQSAFPGFQQAENYYQQMATGDPAALARATAPAVQQIDAQAEATKKRISEDAPRGGAKNLALEENEINRGAQVGNLATQGYLNSFQNLAGLAGQGVGESISSTSTAIGGLSAAGNQYSNIAQQQAEGKASQLGFITSLAGDAATLGAMCWIAEALWSNDDFRTQVVRYYFNEVLDKHWLGRVACGVYRLFGPFVARHIRHSDRWRRAFLPLFTRIARRAMTTVPDEAVNHMLDHWYEIHQAVEE